MRKRPALAVGLFLLVALGWTVLAAAADAPDDEVELVDGTVLKGQITRQAPGSFVTIRTGDGRSQTFAWSQVKRVNASAEPVSPPPVASSTPAAAPTAPPVVFAPPTPEPPSPQAAPLQGERPVHVELGVRVAYAFSSGEYAQGKAIGSPSVDYYLPGAVGMIPLTMDAGVRLGKSAYVGAFVQYAVLSTSCLEAAVNQTFTCTGHDVRAGVDARIHFVPRGTADPWVGVGLGWEWLTAAVSATSPGDSLSETLSGWSVAALMLGVDLRATRGLGIGPYFEFQWAGFTQIQSADIGNKSLHEWLTLGLQGTFEIATEQGGP